VLIVVSVLAMLAGAYRWVDANLPPQYVRARICFFVFRTEIERLESQFEGDGTFLSVRLSPTSKITIVGEGEVPIETIPEDVLGQYAELMQSARVDWIFRSDIGTIFSVGSLVRREKEFRAGLLRVAPGMPMPSKCSKALWLTDFGECTVELDNEWRLIYNWNPGAEYQSE